MTDDVSNVTGIIPPILGLAVAGMGIKMVKDAMSEKRPHSERYGYEHKKKHKHETMHSFWWGD